MSGVTLEPQVLDTVICSAQVAGCEVSRLPRTRGRDGQYHRRLIVDNRLHDVHQLTNSHSSAHCNQSYARGTLVLATLKATRSQVFYVAEPKGDVAILVIPNEVLLEAFFRDGRRHYVFYINHSGAGGRRLNFWLYKDAWKFQRREEQQLVAAAQRIIPDPFQFLRDNSTYRPAFFPD